MDLMQMSTALWVWFTVSSVAGLWCIAEVLRFTLWWTLVVVGPDKFWRHRRLPGAQPQTSPRRSRRTIIHGNTSGLFFFFVCLFCFSNHTSRATCRTFCTPEKTDQNEHRRIFFYGTIIRKEVSKRSTWKKLIYVFLQRFENNRQERNHNGLLVAIWGFNSNICGSSQKYWTHTPSQVKEKVCNFFSLFHFPSHSYPRVAPFHLLSVSPLPSALRRYEHKQMCRYAWWLGRAQGAMEKPWCASAPQRHGGGCSS